MRRIALVAVAAVALVATACTGDDDDDDATPTTTSATTEPTVVTTDEAEPAAPTFTFGVLAPGDAALDELAIGQQRGLTVALDDINAAGGVLGGPVTSVQVEESVDEPLATTLEALAAESDAIVGPVSSATAVEVAALARDQELLVCSASATASSVTADGVAASFFRTAMRDDDTAAAVADRVMDVDADDPPPGTVMVVGRDDVYGTQLAGALSAELAARGASTDTLLYPARRVEFEEEVAAITAADPDVVVLAAFGEGI
ncbi:MAG TPA: ABC transporter substrate-binding protein, partial [Ilumatobacteraceae bacterium]|nr:ABC transporter substrate-binding protein [Ilumatobacteraceae bacterium]